MTKLFLVRHGETTWNSEGRLQGHLDIPLNDKGRWQAKQAASRLVRANITAIYASDLIRAFETAQIIGKRLNLEVIPSQNLREANLGCFQGKTWAEIQQLYPDQFKARQLDPVHAVPEGGESVWQLSQRVIGEVERIIARHPESTVALATHGGVCLTLICHALGLDLTKRRAFGIGNASIHRLEYDGKLWRVLGLNDTCHLEGVPFEKEIDQ
ncbi:MAG: histidine phosphatase family protein [Candidatus Tectomicrobia bacterium]|nr:histidine phosphatase family protein [Candidatus Tectomicrobia bacterium]